MSYLGSTGEDSAVFTPADANTVLDRAATAMHFVAPGTATGGQFGLFRWEAAAHAGGPARHFHRTFSESFYVLEGAVELDDGERAVTATAGDFLHVPMGGVHAFGNTSDAPASMLILFAPGAPREEYFLELAEIMDSGRELSAQEWAEFYARHDQYMV